MAAKRQGHIRVGIGGWVYAPWRKNFYPEGLVQRRELEYASRKLTAIEINGTYYGAQKPATYAKWRSQTPDGFVFSLKAPRYATEARRLAGVGRLVNDFVSGGLAELGDRLGPILWQFSPSRQFDRDDFSALLDLLPRKLEGRPLRHVLEVRNASFLCEDYLQLARTHRLPSVFTDSTEYPSFADLTGDFVYARLMGSQSSIANGYTGTSLDKWADACAPVGRRRRPAELPHVAASAANKGKNAQSRDVYIYFISAAKERNPAAAMALLQRLEE